MKRKINDKYFQSTSLKNDIYRKFEKQFKYCFLNPININDELYVEQTTNIYETAFDLFFNSPNSDIKFFIGYTGVGKTTFIKHYFKFETLGIKEHNDAIIIPISWDGKNISSENFNQQINIQISNIIDNLIGKIYKTVEELILYEADDIINFILDTRSDILSSLELKETLEAKSIGCSINQYKLQKSKDKMPIEISCSLLKYIIEKHNLKNIRRLIFIVDDLETLSQSKLCYVLNIYLKIYTCMHNMHLKPIINLLISLRPHSFRFLNKDISHHYIITYGNYLQNESYRLMKNKIPNIKDIFLTRFENAIKNTAKPGNPATWNMAKSVFYEIINDFDNNILNMIADLCHMNIRAITDCFQMILSNRVWCQVFYNEFPNVTKNDYRFDIVNVVRTLACGENPVYTGKSYFQFNQNDLTDIQSRPSFDGSNTFIPNIFIDIDTNECDILPAIITKYLDGFFSSQNSSPPQTEFITKKLLIDNILQIFKNNVERERISNVIDYLFENRVIRKSIISKDDDETINKLKEEDYLYLTLKGSRLLQMLEADSVLIEIYREDIKREYDDSHYKSSYEFILENNQIELFNDLLELVTDIYENEDIYQRYICDAGKCSSFYDIDFPITQMILKGIEKSLSRLQSINDMDKKILLNKTHKIKQKISDRIKEISSV